jgi:hypothetical protein
MSACFGDNSTPQRFNLSVSQPSCLLKPKNITRKLNPRLTTATSGILQRFQRLNRTLYSLIRIAKSLSIVNDFCSRIFNVSISQINCFR